MFARYAPLLARAGAQVVMEVQPELKGLLAGLDGVAAVVGHGEPLPPFDLHCPLASLPLACKTELANVPADIPYLRADPGAHREVAPASGRPAAAGRAGLVWPRRHVNDRNRSLSLPQLAPLLEAEDVRFVSVQHEPRPADAERLSREPRIIDLGGELVDFADTAAVLSLCDLVICVDTSIAHVAGALGRPAFVLLPFQPDWRWTLDREHSPWYPATRLFRQPSPGDWAASSRGCATSLRCWTSGSPPCRSTSPRADGGKPSAARRTGGRRGDAAATCWAWRWLITDCSRERQRASG